MISLLFESPIYARQERELIRHTRANINKTPEDMNENLNDYTVMPDDNTCRSCCFINSNCYYNSTVRSLNEKYGSCTGGHIYRLNLGKETDKR